MITEMISDLYSYIFLPNRLIGTSTDYISSIWSLSRLWWPLGKSMPDFNRLLEEQIPRLLRYARALTRNTERADDLVQDTLVRALAKQHLWQAGTNLRAWLFTLMHNQNVNNVRYGIREGQNIDVEEMSNVLAATTDPTASRQLYELNRALSQLAQEQRQAILLVGLEEFSYEETAAILNIPVGTVRSRLSRGRDQLRRLMDMPAKAPAVTEAVGPLPQAA
jgi:RNA polymerase sigma-70 factor, ECF subfamily